MIQLLTDSNILSIPLTKNPLISVNVCIKKWKETVGTCEVEPDSILFVGNLESSISINELKNYFSQFGTLKDFKYIGKNDLTKTFKIFDSCAYITYVEKHVVDEILRYSFKIHDFFTNPQKAPYYMETEEKRILKNVQEYYDTIYNLYSGRKQAIRDIQNYNKMNLRKKVKKMIDEEGFTVVQGTSTAVEFYDSVFFNPTNHYNCLVKIKKQRQNKNVHTNLYLFKSKDLRKLEGYSFDNKRSIKKKRMKKRKCET